jgi:hypothetical protein
MNQLINALEPLGFIVMCVLITEVLITIVGSYIKGKYDDQ